LGQDFKRVLSPLLGYQDFYTPREDTLRDSPGEREIPQLTKSSPPCRSIST